MEPQVSKFTLDGLSCSSCAILIENLLKERYDSFVQINFATRTLAIESDDIEGINEIISSVEPGTRALPKTPIRENTRLNRSDWPYLAQVFLSFLLLIIGSVLITNSTGEVWVLLGQITLIIAYLIAGWKVLWRAFLKLKQLDFTNEYFLMSIATLGAILLQEVSEAVAVMVFYTVGEFLQSKAVDRSRDSISALIDLRPDQAHLVQEAGITTLPVEEINPGDIILIKPGERIPLDGKILKGKTSLDMSAITGESRPVRVNPGIDVLSGSITKDSIQVKVTSPFHESTVTRILSAVETATENKSKSELFITRFARYYTPFVLFSAFLLIIIPPFVFQQPIDVWIYRALVILVISCPCALVVSIPLVYFSGIGKSSHEGILLKGANVIDRLTNISAVLWDKTGTLTEGSFEVVEIIPNEGYSEMEVLTYAALAEAHSNHPIAISIREAYGKEVDLTQIEEYEELPALGIKMKTSTGDQLVVGNDKMIHYIECPHSECIDADTVVYVIKNNVNIGWIIIDDQIKEDSFHAINNLKSIGVNRISLLTGDTKKVAERVGDELAIAKENIFANLNPINKLEIIEQFIHESNGEGSVLFVGDGVNDAPVIARADIGVAMGGIGSDATIEAADLVIMDDNPSKLGKAISIAKRTNRIAKQNIAMALGIKAIFIILGVMGLASMWVAVFGDVGVTIIAILNSLRLLR
ncbi:MAG: heavy metal translocating P-type ATPase [Candidatus Hodarchaeales archaeon]|jgi:Cd2+/Zn2+-exporting ATPase